MTREEYERKYAEYIFAQEIYYGYNEIGCEYLPDASFDLLERALEASGFNDHEEHVGYGGTLKPFTFEEQGIVFNTWGRTEKDAYLNMMYNPAVGLFWETYHDVFMKRHLENVELGKV